MRLTASEEKFFKDYISYCGKEPSPSADLLHFWEGAKSEYLFDMFGGKLILEKEIEYEASTEELVSLFFSVASYEARDFLVAISDFLKNNKDFDNSAATTSTNEYFYSKTSYLSSKYTLLNNRWEMPTTLFPLPNGKSFKATPGTKITRIMGRLAKVWHIPGWDEVLRAQSVALTAKNSKGTLCLSIHPLDYITMSDNKEGWNSCMSWLNDGHYRAGTVEMMNSPYVVVAYLKHPTHKLEGFWNSKCWRELFIVHKDVITNIKPYPNVNEKLTKICLEWLKNLAEDAGISVYEDKAYLHAAKSNDDDPIFSEKDLCINFYTNTMYNDCGRANQWMYLRKNLPKHYSKTINYSGERICMCCGEYTNDFDNEGELFCEDCNPSRSIYCDSCGERIPEDEVCYIGDTPYCYECFNDLAVTPWDTGDPCYAEEATEIFLKVSEGEYWTTDYGVYISNNCRDMSSFVSIDKWHYDVKECIYYVNFNEVKDKYFLYEFGLRKEDIRNIDPNYIF